MRNSKLTLSADKTIIEQAKKIARENNTSVEVLFSRYINALARAQETNDELGPLTLKATGLMKRTNGKTDRETLEESLLEKYSDK